MNIISIRNQFNLDTDRWLILEPPLNPSPLPLPYRIVVLKMFLSKFTDVSKTPDNAYKILKSITFYCIPNPCCRNFCCTKILPLSIIIKDPVETSTNKITIILSPRLPIVQLRVLL